MKVDSFAFPSGSVTFGGPLDSRAIENDVFDDNQQIVDE